MSQIAIRLAFEAASAIPIPVTPTRNSGQPIEISISRAVSRSSSRCPASVGSNTRYVALPGPVMNLTCSMNPPALNSRFWQSANSAADVTARRDQAAIDQRRATARQGRGAARFVCQICSTMTRGSSR